MLVKVGSERLSWLRYNQSKLRGSYYSHLHDLLEDAANNNNEINQRIGNKESNNARNVGMLVALPSTHIGSDRYMRQKIHDIIAISNTLGHPDIFITMTCNPYLSETQNALLASQRVGDRPDL